LELVQPNVLPPRARGNTSIPEEPSKATKYSNLSVVFDKGRVDVEG
jgi:hypothetical protein